MSAQVYVKPTHYQPENSMSGQPSLFTRNGDAPLADRLRPKTLADYIG
ncbi:MAG: recombination factor protein RarA, partial [Cardiobacterium sp.]